MKFLNLKKYLAVLLGLLGFAAAVSAQPKDWKLNASDYEYSMSVTTALYYKKKVSTSSADYVAAFVGDELRGVAKLQYVKPLKSYVAFLLVYSNKSQNDTLTFKIYEGAQKVVLPGVNKLPFKSDKVYGTSAQPYYISDTAIPLDISLGEAQVKERLAIGTKVGKLSTFDVVGKKHSYFLVKGTGDNDNKYFAIVGDELRTNAFLNAKAQPQLSVRIESVNDLGYKVQKMFTIKVLPSDGSGQDIAIKELSLSSNTVAENKPSGTLVGELLAKGNLPGDKLTFGLIEGKGAEDNDLFEIVGNTLRTKKPLDFEEKPLRTVRIIVTSQASGVLEQALLVRILDVNEPPIILTKSLKIAENSPKGTLVGKIEAKDPEGGTLRYAHANQTSESSASETFDIGLHSGEVRVNNPKLLDYEKNKKIFLEVAVSDEQGLKTVFILTILLEDVIEAFLPVNNIITPNNDGFNDSWKIRNLAAYKGYSLLIFNAAGRQVYQSNDYQNDWEGTFEGKPLPSGVFYYIFSNPAQGRTFKGAISVIR